MRRRLEMRSDMRTKTPLFLGTALAATMLISCGSDAQESTANDVEQDNVEQQEEPTGQEDDGIEQEPEEAAEPVADETTDSDDDDGHDDDHDDDDHSHDDDEDHDHEEVTDLSGVDLFGEYSAEIPEYGTMVTVTIDEEANTRTITSNALPDHETGEFPNEANPNTISAQDESYTFPLVPEYVGEPTQAQIPAIVFNGVKFEPGTAERAVCDNGITYNIQAVGLSDLVDIPLGLDFNNAHVQPWGEYHYHGTPESVVDNAVAMSGADEDLAFLGFAADGHMIYHSLSEAYSSSYQLGTDEREGTNCVHEARSDAEEAVFFGPEKDGSLAQDWDFDESYGDLDECNGIEIDGEYLYVVTDAYPYVPRCLMGTYEAPARDDADAEGQAGQGGQGGEAPVEGDRPERPAPGEDGEAPAEGEDRPERPAPGEDDEAPAPGEDGP